MQRSVSWSKGQFHISEGKTKSAKRVIPIPADVRPLLAGEGWLFTTRNDTLHNPRNVTRAFNRARDRAGVTCRFHDLRHTYATWLLSRNVPVHTVSKLLGHTSIAITADIYGHCVPSEADVSVLDGLL